ncbi:MAG: hypothetical protein KGR26_04475 [Cyanobacteria bacterium REEB65]|nr:hypothetical protein [Cyanobacteria bacterium REEB65]
MTRIQVNGLLGRSQVATAIAAGADAIGFTMIPASPGYLPPAAIAELAATLPPFVVPVAIVDLTDPLETDRVPDLKKVVARGIRCVQFAGHEPPWEVRRWRTELGVSVVKGFRVQANEDLAELAPYQELANAFRLDVSELDPPLAAHWLSQAIAASRRPVMVALQPDLAAIQEMLGRVRPYAVEIAVGSERDGLESLLEAVREASLLGLRAPGV